MPWVKLDDAFHGHPKAARAGLEALGLHVLAMSRCAERGPVVTFEWVAAVAGIEVARRLVAVGLWERTPDGYIIPGLRTGGHHRLKVPRWLRELVYTRDLGICQICTEPVGESFHVDHIHPVCRGGATVEQNLQLAHASCNLRKGNRV
jgi:hypothetical protein